MNIVTAIPFENKSYILIDSEHKNGNRIVSLLLAIELISTCGKLMTFAHQLSGLNPITGGEIG